MPQTEIAPSTQAQPSLQGRMQSASMGLQAPPTPRLPPQAPDPPSGFSAARRLPPAALPRPPPGFQESEVSIGFNPPPGRLPGLSTSDFGLLLSVAQAANVDSGQQDPTAPRFPTDELASLQDSFKDFVFKEVIFTSLGMLLLTCVVLQRKSDKELEFPLPEEYDELFTHYDAVLSDYASLWEVQRGGHMEVKQKNLVDALDDIWDDVDDIASSFFDTLDPPKAWITRQRLEKIIRSISGLKA